jgi:Sodium:dicarboxylate symporter family
MLTSKGMAGVPGSSFLALSATVAAVGTARCRVAAVALLLGADRIMDSMRVSVNLLGNCVATFVVASGRVSWTGSGWPRSSAGTTWHRSTRTPTTRANRRSARSWGPVPATETGPSESRSA